MKEKEIIVDAGFTVGKIKELLMGTNYTSVHIREEGNPESVHHIILVKNNIGVELHVGQSVKVKLGIFE